jgi:pilus assembly protein CpaE
LSALVAPVQPDAKDSIPAALVTDLLDALAHRYDYVVVDTPPALDDPVLAAFDNSDVVLLLATLDIPALKNLKLTLETLQMIDFPADRRHVVLNRADSKVGLSVQDSEKTLKTHVAAQIPSSRDVPSSVNAGELIVQQNPKHPVSRAIHEIATRLVPPTAASSAESAKPTVDVGADDEKKQPARGGLRRRRRT